MDMFERTKTASYLLWEATRCDNALELWRLAEDIACFLEHEDIVSPQSVAEAGRDVGYEGYVPFVRHIAFRIYLYTGNDDDVANWFTAESLLRNSEWVAAETDVARLYRAARGDHQAVSGIKSDFVRRYYYAMTRVGE